MRKEILAFPRNANYSAALNAYHNKLSRQIKNKDRAIFVSPSNSRFGGNLSGHELYLTQSTGVLTWYMHGTRIAEWHPDGARIAFAPGWAGTNTTREMWSYLLGMRVRKIDRLYGRLAETTRVMAPGFSHGIPWHNDSIQVSPHGYPVQLDDIDTVRVLVPELRAEAQAHKRRIKKIVCAAAQLMPAVSAYSVRHPRSYGLEKIIGASPDDLLSAIIEECGALSPDMGERFDVWFPIDLFYDALNAYAWKQVPSSEVHNYVPKA